MSSEPLGPLGLRVAETLEAKPSRLSWSAVAAGSRVVALLLLAPVALAASSNSDLENGRRLYHGGACYACHRPDPEQPDRLPIGGRLLATPVGWFDPGNLTPDPETGLGRWSDNDFLRAMTQGISPAGKRYLPAFPFRSYSRMTQQDLLDLWAYLRSLPPRSRPRQPNRIRGEGFLRAATRLWVRLAGWPGPVTFNPAQSELWNRGAYLVLSAGHCGECHTPRRHFFLPLESRHLAGGVHPSEPSEFVPSLRGLSLRYPGAAELAQALAWGEAGGYENLSAGGMGAIQEELSHLPEGDLLAIATYLLSLEPLSPAATSKRF